MRETSTKSFPMLVAQKYTMRPSNWGFVDYLFVVIYFLLNQGFFALFAYCRYFLRYWTRPTVPARLKELKDILK